MGISREGTEIGWGRAWILVGQCTQIGGGGDHEYWKKRAREGARLGDGSCVRGRGLVVVRCRGSAGRLVITAV